MGIIVVNKKPTIIKCTNCRNYSDRYCKVFKIIITDIYNAKLCSKRSIRGVRKKSSFKKKK